MVWKFREKIVIFRSFYLRESSYSTILLLNYIFFFSDVVAYVEVFSGADNRSAIIGNVLRDLGAAICQRFINKVTHVVFREGRQSTVERARSKNIHLVSVLWVDA